MLDGSKVINQIGIKNKSEKIIIHFQQKRKHNFQRL